MVMVKPGIAYLDIVRVKMRFMCCRNRIPCVGEYAMIKAASERGWLDHDQTMMEQLMYQTCRCQFNFDLFCQRSRNTFK
jgi:porphobilinogen synthase